MVYRLDAHVAHLLLDEFQDTSALQWRVLRPFAQRVGARDGGRSFFCVGDVKQAIYGWRGGVAEIFEALEEDLGRLTRKELHKSSAVLAGGDRVGEPGLRKFDGIADNPVLQKCAGRRAELGQAVQDAHDRPRRLPGYCCMLTAAQAAEGEDLKAATLRCAAERIVRLQEQAPRQVDRRPGAAQRGRRPADLRTAPPWRGRQRGGGQPVDRFAGRAVDPFAADAGRSSGRHGRALPRGHLAAGPQPWGIDGPRRLGGRVRGLPSRFAAR